MVEEYNLLGIYLGVMLVGKGEMLDLQELDIAQ
jgi:hypothetical protein